MRVRGASWVAAFAVLGMVVGACGGDDDASVELGVEATATPVAGIAPLEVVFDAEIAGASVADVTFAWAFGDGGSSDARSPTHVYEAPGSYTATVTVTLGEAVATASVRVTVGADGRPVVSALAEPTRGLAPLEVAFEAVAAGGDGALSYEWDFGDGSAAGRGARVSHLFESAGSYDVVVTVHDEDGDTATDTVSIAVGSDEVPAVIASADVTAGRAPLVVNVTCEATGGNEPLRYAWDFADGRRFEGAATVHTYATPGTLDATCTVIDADGSTAHDRVTITVSRNDVPTAVASVTRLGTDAPLDVAFDGAAVGGDGALTYAWTFGDGTVSTEQSPAHTYTAAGTYRAVLTVTDEDGDYGVDTVTVVVTTPPVLNAPPIPTAEVASGSCAIPGRTVVELDASSSTDPEDDALEYQWAFVRLPAGSTARLNDATIVNPTFTPDRDGTYELRVFVTDGESRVASDTVRIEASGPRTLTAISGGGQSAQAGATFGAPLIVRVKNGCDALVPSQWLRVYADNAHAFSSTTDATGEARVSVEAGSVADEARVAVVVERTGAADLVATFDLTVTAGEIAQVVLRPIAPASIGAPMSLSFVLADRFGNTAAPAEGEDTTLTACISPSGASFDPDTPQPCIDLTTVSGAASAVVHSPTAGWYDLSVTTAASLGFSGWVQVFSDDLEAEGSTWSAADDPSTERWERGSPSAPGPGACASGTGCWGTDLDGPYRAAPSGTRANVLTFRAPTRSLPPPFGRSVEGVMVTQSEWYQLEPADPFGCSDLGGAVIGIRAGWGTDLRPEGGFDTYRCLPGRTGSSGGWVTTTYRGRLDWWMFEVPEVTWALTRDDAATTGAGWYVDDVQVSLLYQTSVPLRFVAACSDGIDNDGDGIIDYPFEPGCATPDDDDETDPTPLPQCANGIDDDGDGLIDYPDDPDCHHAADNTESPQCANGIDDDGDGWIDMDDPRCVMSGGTSEFGRTSPYGCNNGIDDDLDGLIDADDPDCLDGFGEEGGGGGPLGTCENGIDDDGDGWIDMDDLDCSFGPDETGMSHPFTCSDMIDNNGNGLVDGEDPVCRFCGPLCEEM